MPLLKPPVAPLPAATDLSGKTAIVTGATSGIGLEVARQLVELHIFTLVLAVRDLTKGEDVRRTLLALNSDVVVKVMCLDMADYASVQSFATAFLAEHDELHLLILNAGVGGYTRAVAPSGYEMTIQVNILSNVLLMFALLPVLEATPGATRVTWVGSRLHVKTSLAKKSVLKDDENLLAHLNRVDTYSMFTRYFDSKLLCVLFLYELKKRMPSSSVVVNAVCPGMVKTAMGDGLPLYMRAAVALVRVLMARDAAAATVLVLNAAIVAGSESHGELLVDKDVAK